MSKLEIYEKAAETLLAKGAGTVILTLGDDGVYLASANLRECVPAFRVEAVDITAAGDVFCGTLVEGKFLPEAARFA